MLAKHKDSFTLCVGLSAAFYYRSNDFSPEGEAVGGYVLGDRFTTRLPGLWAGTISRCLMIATGIYEYFVV
ncbi:hypothetical protein [Fischerella thermalis]|uniref:hypothetical protein n=1 Tax=Fischerella thermalis TaxID=372787 RepID=UPI0011AFC991|nr:hypothetical protein [Fischerella thermalis]